MTTRRACTLPILTLALTACSVDSAPGARGPQGPAGDNGIVGDAGPTGATGDVGPTGATGMNGENGADGLNCWDLDGNGMADDGEDVNGDGEWNANDCGGPEGQQGPPGPQGIDGPVGPQGPPGSPDTGAEILVKLAGECHDPLAVAKYGFCLWHDLGQNKTYQQAGAMCIGEGGRLCSRAELSAAQLGGLDTCANGWLADRVVASNGDDTQAYIAYARSTSVPGCGNGKIGIVESVYPMSSLFGAYCCRP